MRLISMTVPEQEWISVPPRIIDSLKAKLMRKPEPESRRFKGRKRPPKDVVIEFDGPQNVYEKLPQVIIGDMVFRGVIIMNELPEYAPYTYEVSVDWLERKDGGEYGNSSEFSQVSDSSAGGSSDSGCD